jgi:hypothetical protein
MTDTNISSSSNGNVEVTLPDLTPYEASKVLNILLEQSGSEKRIKPQQMYGYAKSGKIASNYKTRGDDEKVLFEGEAIKKFMDAYISGTIESGQRKDYNELASLFS